MISYRFRIYWGTPQDSRQTDFVLTSKTRVVIDGRRFAGSPEDLDNALQDVTSTVAPAHVTYRRDPQSSRALRSRGMDWPPVAVSVDVTSNP